MTSQLFSKSSMVWLKHLVKIVSLAFKNFLPTLSWCLCSYFRLHPFYALHLFPVKVLPNAILRLFLTMYPCLGSLLHKPIPSKRSTLRLRSMPSLSPKLPYIIFLQQNCLVPFFFFTFTSVLVSCLDCVFVDCFHLFPIISIIGRKGDSEWRRNFQTRSLFYCLIDRVQLQGYWLMMCVLSCSVMSDSLWHHQAPLSTGFSQQGY